MLTNHIVNWFLNKNQTGFTFIICEENWQALWVSNFNGNEKLFSNIWKRCFFCSIENMFNRLGFFYLISN